MKLFTVGTIFGVLTATLETAVNAEQIRYEMKGNDNGIPYSITVNYDNESEKIVTDPWGICLWSCGDEELNVADGVIEV